MLKIALPIFIVDEGRISRRQFGFTQADADVTSGCDDVLRGCTQDETERLSDFAANTNYVKHSATEIEPRNL